MSPLGPTDVTTSTIATICFQETAESWSLGQELQALQHFLVITGTELRPQELQTHVYVEQPLESMVPLSLRHVDENLYFSIVIYSDLIPGNIESSSLGRDLRVLHYVLQQLYSFS